MSQPWTTAPEAGSFSLQPYTGCLVLIAIGGYHANIQTRNGPGDAVRAAVVVLDGAEAGREFGDILIFNNRPVRRLRGMAGQVVLHRIVVEIAQGGNNAFDLSDPTPADNQLAISWHNAFPGKLEALRRNVDSAYMTEERKLQQPQPQRQQQQQPQQWQQPQWQQPQQPQWAPTQAPSPASPPTTPPSTPAWAQPPQWQQPSVTFQSVANAPAPAPNVPVEPSSPPPWSGNGQRSAVIATAAGGWPGPGNLDVDPLFALAGYWADPADTAEVLPATDPSAVWVDGDYHLLSEAGRWDPFSKTWAKDPVTSLCIDAGDPSTPTGPEPSPNGGRVNLGVYGGTNQAGMSPGDG